MTSGIHLTLAHSIMADLRQRGELCYILAPVKPESGPWATLETQARIEERIAEIILAGLVPVAVEMAEIKERAEALEDRVSEMKEARLTGLADDIARQIESHDDFDCPSGMSFVRAARNIADSIVARFGIVPEVAK